MENIIFEDNMKEYKKTFIILLILGVTSCAIAIFAMIQSGETYKTMFIGPLIATIILSGYSIFGVMYSTKYNVVVKNNNICVTTHTSYKTMELKPGIKFVVKPIQSHYFIFTITNEEKTISLRTKKAEELAKILVLYK